MERAPLLLLILTIATIAIFAYPQAEASLVSPPIEKRVALCLQNHCTMEERLKLMDELADDAHASVQHIRQTCRKADYKNNCFDPNNKVAIRAHRSIAYLSDVLRSMELQYGASRMDNFQQLDLIEPAAGPDPAPNPYTNPDEQDLRQDKRGWWKGEDWAPPDEANPYHQW
jgi:hypothetical protein